MKQGSTPDVAKTAIKGTVPFIAETAIEGAGALVLGAAALAVWLGSWRVDLLDISVSLSRRAIWRPLLVTAVLLALRWLFIRGREGRRAQFTEAAARVVAGALLTAGLLSWTAYVAPYLGGSDSYGYVSAAERIRAGTLIQPEPLAAHLPGPNPVFAATPLGYIGAARVPGASVPTYQLGLPAMMAAASAVAGQNAPFYVPLGCGLLLTATCYWLTRRWTSDRFTAITACAVLAFHPVVFAYVIQAMSDVPATAFFLLAAAFLVSNSVSMAMLGGLAAALAFLTRNAILPGVGALALVPFAIGEKRLARAAAYCLALGSGGVIQLWLQWYLYGHPLANGYGAMDTLFSFTFLQANVRSFAYWGFTMHGAVWTLGLLAGLLHMRDRSAWMLLAATLMAALPYVIFKPQDHWETQRFLLPLLVVTTMYAVCGLVAESRRVAGGVAGRWIGVALAIVMIVSWVRWLDREQVLQLGRAEERFAQAGELVARVTPAGAVVLASLHSGSLRYYAHRQTADWAKIAPGQFETTVAALKNAGLPVFLMLDGQEEQTAFERLHGRVIDDRAWLPAGQRRDIRLFEAPR